MCNLSIIWRVSPYSFFACAVQHLIVRAACRKEYSRWSDILWETLPFRAVVEGQAGVSCEAGLPETSSKCVMNHIYISSDVCLTKYCYIISVCIYVYTDTCQTYTVLYNNIYIYIFISHIGISYIYILYSMYMYVSYIMYMYNFQNMYIHMQFFHIYIYIHINTYHA